MDFLKLIQDANPSERNARLNDDTISNATIAGMKLFKARNQKVYFIVDLLIDSSTAKSPQAVAHAAGSVVSDMMELTADWGPGKAKEVLFAAAGVDEKSVEPSKLQQLLSVALRKSEEAPNGDNRCRGMRVRVETVPYTTKAGKARFVSRYSHIPTTKEEVTANRQKLDAAGIK